MSDWMEGEMRYRPKDWVTGNGYPPGDNYSVGYEEGADSLLEGLKAEGKSFKAGTGADIVDWLMGLVESGANGTLVFIPGRNRDVVEICSRPHPYQGESID